MQHNAEVHYVTGCGTVCHVAAFALAQVMLTLCLSNTKQRHAMSHNAPHPVWMNLGTCRQCLLHQWSRSAQCMRLNLSYFHLWSCVNERVEKLRIIRLLRVAARDVNETWESQSFFSIPGKEFLDFKESRLATARQQGLLWAAQLSPVAPSLLSIDRLYTSPRPRPEYQTHSRETQNSGISKW